MPSITDRVFTEVEQAESDYEKRLEDQAALFSFSAMMTQPSYALQLSMRGINGEDKRRVLSDKAFEFADDFMAAYRRRKLAKEKE